MSTSVPEANTPNRGLAKALASVSALTFLSRVLGLARDICIASVFKVGFTTDAFFVAFKLPNLLRRLFAEGAFTQAFVPVFNEYRRQRGEREGAVLADETATALLLALLAITAIGTAAAPLLIHALAPGFASIPGKTELATSLLRITFPYILLVSLTAFGAAILNSHSRFKTPAFAPALLNVAMITATLVVAPRMESPIHALAWGVLAGGALQFAWMAGWLLRIGALPRLTTKFASGGVSRITKLMGQGAIGVSIAQLSLAINMLIASFLAEGSVSWLYYADRLMELPAGMLGAALATIILPGLSRHHAQAETREFNAILDWALRMTLLLALPAACGLATIATPLAATLFEHGEFSPEDTRMTARALVAYSVGIVGLIAVKVLASGFFARQDIKTPVKVAAITLFATQAMNLMFVWHLKHAGLALAIGLAACLNAGILLHLMLARKIYTPLPGWKRLITQVVVACTAMSALIVAFAPATEFWTESSVAMRVASLGCLVAGGAAVYCATLAILGVRPSDLRQKGESE